MPLLPIRYQCRHIFTDGHRCGSPCLKGEPFCYYHHTTRKPAPRPTTTDTFDLPLPEDRSSIQAGIGMILQRIANNQIDLRRAGLLLYGLQTASLNIPKPKEPKHPEEVVEEIVSHPELGEIALESDITAQPNRRRSFAEILMQELAEHGDAPFDPEPRPQLPQQPYNWAQILPDIQATAHPPRHQRHQARTRQHARTRTKSVSSVQIPKPLSVLSANIRGRASARFASNPALRESDNCEH